MWRMQNFLNMHTFLKSPKIPTFWPDASLGDVVAGATVACTSLPQYIAYAELVGLSGHHGLRASGPPLLAFAFVTGSPTLSIGVTSMSAIMAETLLRGESYREENGVEAWINLLSAFSLLVGLASLALSAAGAAQLATSIPDPVRIGWKLGLAMIVVSCQSAGAFFGNASKFVKKECILPSLSFPWSDAPWEPSGGAASLYCLGWTLLHPHRWDLATVALAVLALGMVLRGRGLLGPIVRTVTFRHISEPIPGLEVIVATIAGTLLSTCCQYDGSVVGVPEKVIQDGLLTSESQSGLTSATQNLEEELLKLTCRWLRTWPWEMPWSELVSYLGGWPSALCSATIFALVDFMQIVSVVDEGPYSRELAGQGVGCIVSGMAGSAPVGGSLSRSLVAKMAGASSQMTGLVSGMVTMALASPAIAILLSPMPKAILAAVVLAAVLPSVAFPKDLRKLRGADSVVGWTTFVASVLTDPTKGFVIGVVAYGLINAKKGHLDEEQIVVVLKALKASFIRALLDRLNAWRGTSSSEAEGGPGQSPVATPLPPTPEAAASKSKVRHMVTPTC